MVIIAITLLLGLKGLFRGLIKEVFGIIGIIGAIFVASRVSTEVGNLIAPFLAIENQTTLNLIGFILALIGFWFIVYLLGVLISKIFAASGLGLFDRFFGFVFGAAKIFMILSIIAYALYQVSSFRKAIDEKTQGSLVMPKLLGLGGYIIKLDTGTLSDTIGKTVDKAVNKAKEITNNELEKEDSTINEIKEEVNSTVDTVKESIKEEVDSAVDTVKEKLQDVVIDKKE